MKEISLNCSCSKPLVPSKYNITVRSENGGGILYNSRTGARAEVAPDMLNKEQMLALEQGSWSPQLDMLPAALITFLTEHQFLVKADLNEFEVLEAFHNHFAHNPHLPRVMVILTRHCNLTCQYCYQDKSLPDPVPNLERVIKHITGQVVPQGVLQVTWFGGEPLLRLKLICDLSDRIIPLCDQASARYNSTISTNGLLLSPKTVDALRSRRINTFQISLDGPPDVHESRRPSKNAKPTYEAIIHGIERLVQSKAEVHIKIMMDRMNARSIGELFLDLERRRLLDSDLITIAIQGVEAKFSAADYRHRIPLLGEFAATKMELLDKLVSLGYKIPEPTQRWEFCAANSEYSTAVDLAGNTYRCGQEAANITGYIDQFGKTIITNPSYDCLFTSREYALVEECRTCRVLPICGGGCTLAGNGLALRETCTFYKAAIRDYLVLLSKQDCRARSRGGSPD